MKRLSLLLPLLALAAAPARAENPATDEARTAQISTFPGEPAVLITDRMAILDYLCAEMEGGGATESLLAGCSPAGVRVDFRALLNVPGLSSETWERLEIPWTDIPTNLTITRAHNLSRSRTIRIEPAGKDARPPRDSAVEENPSRDELLARFLGPGAPAAPDAAFELVHPYGAGAVRSTNLVWLAEFLPAAPDPASGRGRLLARVSGDFAEVFRTVDTTAGGGRTHSRIDVCKVPLSALPATLDLPGGDYKLRRLPPPPWRGGEAFAARLFRATGRSTGGGPLPALRGTDGNAVVAPLGAASQLALLHFAARSQAPAEIARMVGATGGDAPAELAAVRAALPATGPAPAYSQRDAVWLAPGQEAPPAFVAWADEAFGAAVGAVPTLPDGRPDAARLPFLGDGSWGGTFAAHLAAEPSHAVLVDTVRFSAPWALPFHGERVATETFHAPNGDARVQFLHGIRSAECGRGAGYETLRLPYDASGLELLVVLPDEGVPLGDVEARLGPALFRGEGGDEPRREVVDIALPVLRVESRRRLGLDFANAFRPALRPAAGAAAEALADVPSAGPFRFVEQVQEISFSLDAQGSLVDPALVREPGSRRWPPPTRAFRADRPFLFAVRDRVGGAVLLLGRIERPAPLPGREAEAAGGPVAATLLGADGAVVHGPFVVACDPNGGPIQGTVPLRCAFLVRDWRSLHDPDILALETLDVEWKPGESGAPAFSIHRAASRGNGRAEKDWLSVERALPADIRLPWSGETLRFETAAPGTPAANIVSDPVRIAIAPACIVPPRGDEPACLATPSEELDWKKEGAKPVVAGGTELYHLVERHPGGNVTELHAHPCVDGIHLELRSLTPEARFSYIAWRLAPYDILPVDVALPGDLGSVHLERAPATRSPAADESHANSADGAKEPAP